MRNKILFALVAMFLLVPGMRTKATPYAVYCEGDRSFHLLDTEEVLEAEGTLASNGETITKVWEVVLDNTTGYPAWNTEIPDVTKVVIEESFKNVEPVSCRCWFSELSSLTEIEGLENLNVAALENVYGMFQICPQLTEIDLSPLSSAKLTDMGYMFCECNSLTTIDLTPLDTSEVIDMNGMFYGCTALTTLTFGSADTGKVTNMNAMFYNCKSLTDLNISNFDTGNVINMSSMFNGCSGLTTLDISNFNTAKVENMGEMFKDCTSLTSLDLSDSFDTANVTDMQGMFNSCGKLTSLDLRSFNTANVTNMKNMFNQCECLTSLDLSNFNTGKVTDMSYMFGMCSTLAELVLGNDFKTENVTDMSWMFNNDWKLTSLNLTTFNTANVTDMECMFYNCQGLTSLDLKGFNTEKVTNMHAMFYCCFALSSLDLSSFDTKNVTNMECMFYNCYFTSLDLSNFNTEKVTDMFGLFYYCDKLAYVDLSGFYIDEAAYTDNIFGSCSSLRTVIFGKGLDDFAKLANTSLTQITLVFVDESTTGTDGWSNIVKGDLCDHLIINYENENQLLWTTPRDFTASQVSIQRKFVKDCPYTLYLPFAIENAAQYGTFYGGGKLNAAGDEVIFSMVTEDQTAADTPYMFIPNADFNDGITFSGSVAVANLTGETDADGLQGVADKKVFTADEAAQKVYYGWANGEFCWAEEGATVDACRAYYRLPASAAAKAPAVLRASFGDNEGTTGITEIESEDGNDSPAYNINGQRVDDSYRGIVIKKGTKTANFIR